MGPLGNRRSRTIGLGAAAAAAVLSPIPLADELLHFPALLGVGAAVGRERGLKLGELPWPAMAKSAAMGLASRAVVNLAVAYVPGVAAVANATSAYALTRYYAIWADGACADPRHAAPPSRDDLIALFRAVVPRSRPH